MKNGLLEIAGLSKFVQVNVIAVFTDAVERLVERRQPLLTIQDQERVGLTGQRGCALELPGREHALGVAHSKNAASGVVVGDRDDQFLRGARFPNKIALEIRQHHRPRVDFSQQILQCARVCVFKEVHQQFFFRNHFKTASPRVRATPRSHS